MSEASWQLLTPIGQRLPLGRRQSGWAIRQPLGNWTPPAIAMQASAPISSQPQVQRKLGFSRIPLGQSKAVQTLPTRVQPAPYISSELSSGRPAESPNQPAPLTAPIPPTNLQALQHNAETASLEPLANRDSEAQLPSPDVQADAEQGGAKFEVAEPKFPNTATPPANANTAWQPPSEAETTTVSEADATAQWISPQPESDIDRHPIDPAQEASSTPSLPLEPAQLSTDDTDLQPILQPSDVPDNVQTLQAKALDPSLSPEADVDPSLPTIAADELTNAIAPETNPDFGAPESDTEAQPIQAVSKSVEEPDVSAMIRARATFQPPTAAPPQAPEIDTALPSEASLTSSLNSPTPLSETPTAPKLQETRAELSEQSEISPAIQAKLANLPSLGHHHPLGRFSTFTPRFANPQTFTDLPTSRISSEVVQPKPIPQPDQPRAEAPSNLPSTLEAATGASQIQPTGQKTNNLQPTPESATNTFDLDADPSAQPVSDQPAPTTWIPDGEIISDAATVSDTATQPLESSSADASSAQMLDQSTETNPPLQARPLSDPHPNPTQPIWHPSSQENQPKSPISPTASHPSIQIPLDTDQSPSSPSERTPDTPDQADGETSTSPSQVHADETSQLHESSSISLRTKPIDLPALGHHTPLGRFSTFTPQLVQPDAIVPPIPKRVEPEGTAPEMEPKVTSSPPQAQLRTAPNAPAPDSSPSDPASADPENSTAQLSEDWTEQFQLDSNRPQVNEPWQAQFKLNSVVQPKSKLQQDLSLPEERLFEEKSDSPVTQAKLSEFPVHTLENPLIEKDQHSGQSAPMSPAQLEQIAHVCYKLLRSRFALAQEFQNRQTTDISPWPDVVLLLSYPAKDNNQQPSKFNTEYLVSEPTIQALTNEIEGLIQQRLQTEQAQYKAYYPTHLLRR